MRKADRKIKKKQDEFFQREMEANATRRKPLDTVDYISIPVNDFPMELEKEDLNKKDNILLIIFMILILI